MTIWCEYELDQIVGISFIKTDIVRDDPLVSINIPVGICTRIVVEFNAPVSSCPTAAKMASAALCAS